MPAPQRTMKVLYNWLKEFVEVKATPAELRSRLSLSGTAVDAIEESVAGPVLDAELTSNRPDCLGHYGIAREVAALYGLDLKPVKPKLVESKEAAANATRVEMEAPDLCARYTARVMRGVKVQPSPDWLRQRLEALGLTSINNVVDVTNYVMLELGHPLHAFDFDKLAERRIVVRRARAGEKIRTLDGIERKLSKDMCVIADAANAVAIGGVMGGADSEIGFATRNILIEAAWFDPISIRRTSKALGLRTEASVRFERGGDIEMAELASRRAAELIQQVAGGEILAGVVDAYPNPQPLPKLEMTRKEFLRVMGADVTDREIESILAALGFAPVRVDVNRGSADSIAAAWECRSASWRRDVTREIDLIEEVARIHGYDQFPPRMPASRQPATRSLHALAEDLLRQRLIGLGYQEIVAIPLVNKEHDELFRPGGAAPAAIANPLSEEASTLRTSGVVSMLGALEWNLNRGQRNLRLFEIGRTYGLKNGKPNETRILNLGATGQARERSIHEEAREFEFADLKGDIDRIGELAGGIQWSSGAPEWLAHAASGKIGLLISGNTLGAAGKIARKPAEVFKLRTDAYVAELELEPLLQAIDCAREARRYEPLPRFPAVERDFSLLLADGIKFSQVAETIRATGIGEITRVEAVDLFRGKNVPAGKYSLLVRVTFQSAQATFTDTQLTDFSARIVAALEKSLGATLRAS
ncbi:MAG TPA: phenylalanine--tRNA ligase subunit beta [Candidatus Acidoferrales bacterium]|nr:phenylalanine--tRNA ligase subunit beta [Candidatus Acidoferrales bacterium]